MSHDIATGRRRDAYHEAAHAAFFHHAGASIKWALITNAEGGGLVRYESPANPTPSQFMDLAAGSLAGWHAGERLDEQDHVRLTFEEFELRGIEGIAAEADLMTPPGADFESVREALSEERSKRQQDGTYRPMDEEYAYEDLKSAVDAPLSPWSSLEEGYDEACKRVAQGLQHWWQEIEAVAGGLLQASSGRLEGNGIVQLIESAQRPGGSE